MNVADEFKTYLQVLWRYKWMTICCAILASLAALGISLLLTPLYSATTTVRVASAPGGSTDYTYLASFTRLSNTYVEIATSDISLDEVAERLGLQKQPKVEVEIVPETELITIKASDPDPARARDIANTLANLLIEQSAQLYGGNAPSAREILEGQLQQAKDDLDTAVLEYESALRGAQSPVTPPVSGTPIPDPNVESMASVVSVRQQIYSELLQRYEAARTSEQLRANAITITESAYLPQKPASPKVPLNVALGLVAGLAIGVILAFLFEAMDDTLRGIEDVQRMTTLPILSTIPILKRRLGSKADPGFSRNGHLSPAPAFDQLRARLILFDVKPKAATFLITSPEPGAGKSTVAANLAVSLTQGGNRVVLVDMDFRRPRQHFIFGLPNELGLSNFISGEIQLQRTLQTTTHPELRVITVGSSQNIPYKWLTPEKIGSLFQSLGVVFDYVLIDTPALLSVADPMVLASEADAVILVVAKRKTERKNLRFALQQLAEIKANIAGIVMNKMPNSQLYSYYSKQLENQGPFQKGKSTNLVADEAVSKAAGLEKK